MEQLLIHRKNLQSELDAEWLKYNKAIKADKELEEVKKIYKRIKELKSQIRDITNEIREKLNIGD